MSANVYEPHAIDLDIAPMPRKILSPSAVTTPDGRAIRARALSRSNVSKVSPAISVMVNAQTTRHMENLIGWGNCPQPCHEASHAGEGQKGATEDDHGARLQLYEKSDHASPCDGRNAPQAADSAW